jgi:6-phosphogluconate dehydrogenase
MQLGMIGLGRMGANMVRRATRGGHACVVYDRDPAAAKALTKETATAATSLAELVKTLTAPRTVWIMVPAAAVDAVLDELGPLLAKGDAVIDGGNSFYGYAARRAQALEKRGIQFLDVGTSGGVHGLERGYCLMIGGPAPAVKRLDPLFKTLAPADGYLHCGPVGAGHFVKMVHNGIEYGMMAAYAEGFNVLRHAKYPLNLGAIAEVWRHGSVVSSWLLDLTARAFARQPELAGFSGHVSDSGEGRWTIQTAIEAGVPVPVLSAALYERFTSRGEGDFAAKLLSALRFEFGGHEEKA